jgi:soluble cytochrome b562
MSGSISSVSSSGYQNYQTDSSKDQFKQDMLSIQTALQAGDLGAAKDAFSKLQDLQQQRDTKKGTTSNQTNPVQKDMQTLQSALDSGNVQDAQGAFKQLQTDMKANHLGHHHNQVSSSPTQAASATTAEITGAIPSYA